MWDRRTKSVALVEPRDLSVAFSKHMVCPSQRVMGKKPQLTVSNQYTSLVFLLAHGTTTYDLLGDFPYSLGPLLPYTCRVTRQSSVQSYSHSFSLCDAEHFAPREYSRGAAFCNSSVFCGTRSDVSGWLL